MDGVIDLFQSIFDISFGLFVDYLSLDNLFIVFPCVCLILVMIYGFFFKLLRGFVRFINHGWGVFWH